VEKLLTGTAKSVPATHILSNYTSKSLQIFALHPGKVLQLMHRVPHSRKNIFIEEKVETLHHLNTRIIPLELLRIPTPERAPIPQKFTHRYDVCSATQAVRDH
jgi:hypothetical protein